MESIDGPEGERLRDEMLARMAGMMDELRGAPPFDVAGLDSPILAPRRLAESGNMNGTWHHVSLFFGDGGSKNGPAVTVRSAMEAGMGDLLSGGVVRVAEPALIDVLEDDRDRLYNEGGIDEPDPVDPPSEGFAELHLAGSLVGVELIRSGGLWAARVALPMSTTGGDGRLVLTVVARGVPFEEVRLGWVRDLTPFVEGWEEWFASMTARVAEAGPAPEVVAPAGETALRELLGHTLESSRQVRAALAADRKPRTRPRSSGERHHALWRAAVAAQAAAWQQNEAQANEQVTVAVNHLTHLDEAAAWFTEDTELRDAAVDETIAYTVHGEAVSSIPAQRAWLEFWRVKHRFGQSLLAVQESGPTADTLAAVQDFMGVDRDLKARWLSQCDEWVAGRRPIPRDG